MSKDNVTRIGVVIDGKLVTNDERVTDTREHQLHRQYVKDTLRSEYARDIVQPYKNGQVNQEYIEAWGKEEAINKGLVENNG